MLYSPTGTGKRRLVGCNDQINETCFRERAIFHKQWLKLNFSSHLGLPKDDDNQWLKYG